MFSFSSGRKIWTLRSQAQSFRIGWRCFSSKAFFGALLQGTHGLMKLIVYGRTSTSFSSLCFFFPLSEVMSAFPFLGRDWNQFRCGPGSLNKSTFVDGAGDPSFTIVVDLVALPFLVSVNDSFTIISFTPAVIAGREAMVVLLTINVTSWAQTKYLESH